MELNQSIEHRQTQTLAFEQMLSLNILQMSALELNTEISRELEENPVLEADEDANDEEGFLQDNVIGKLSFKELIQASEDNSYRNTDFSAAESEQSDKLALIGKRKTLKDYLFEQLSDLKIEKRLASICGYIIESIDGRGYLDYKAVDIAKDLMTSEKEAAEALAVVRDFQPDGIASQNLQECLKTQLEKRNMISAGLCFIIDEGLELLAGNKIKQLAKKAGITVHEAVVCANIIKSLRPFPAEGFYTGDADAYIVPDAYVVESGGRLCVVMNDRFMPSLVISGVYKDIMKNSTNAAERAFIKERLCKAALLIKGIEQRKSTMLSVFELITEMQGEYLATGRNLKPMTLKNLAVRLNMHESTISRAVRGKYMSTPRGLVYIKDLFTSKLKTEEDDCRISSREVKNEIKRLIKNEQENKPLSDLQICDMLKCRGIAISRRTVAKYREALNIGSSAKRKKYD